MRQLLTAEVAAGARLRAAEIAAEMSTGNDGLPADAIDPDEGLVQVVDADGRVVTSTANVAGRPVVASLRPGQSAEVTTPLDDGPFIAVAVGADTRQGPLTVIVARALEDVNESVQLLAGLLAVGVPGLTVIVALVTWAMVGRALRPVEVMRREVDAISASELHRRVPAPEVSDEIGRLARTMNRMLDRLETAQERQRRFVADASHELRSPVSVIREYAEVAIAHPERIALVELAQTVLAEDLRIQRLVDDLLLLARADEHTLQLRLRAVDLDDLVFEEASRLGRTGALRVDTSAVAAGRVQGDADSLRRVVGNLAQNAARHARQSVAFSLVHEGATVRLTVEDDGPGIPADQRERVFERFVRLDEARARDGGGSGLGLAIVAELVAAHGGSVRAVEGELGGARIEVDLPAGS